MSHWGFDGRRHTGQLVVNREVAAPLATVLEALRVALPDPAHAPRRHVRPHRARPADGDITGSFRCRQAVPSPCVEGGGGGVSGWSNHAYGYAIDVNPVENPYVGCGRTRDSAGARYLDRSRLRKGMVTPAVVRAFRSIGWGWGGDWTGDTKDYMHFSVNGR